MADTRKIPRPPKRKLRAFAFDPGLKLNLETTSINSVTIEIPWENDPDDPDKDGPSPGPVGEYIEVVDYDPASHCFYEPINLSDPHIIAQDGLEPSDGDPQFHQQMVYAVSMKTIKYFEQALGRLVLWAPRRFEKQGTRNMYVPRLRIYPHAFREANAYYSPSKKALLFGYFPADNAIAGYYMPGGIVFTCLSHDIIVHEITHALLDGSHPRFGEPSNPDVLAFHEAFADIVAIFQHFTFPEVVRHQIAKTKGDLKIGCLLSDLAHEFGQAIGRTGALRSALNNTPDPLKLKETMEPHYRGSILVAAIFDAFLSIYYKRIDDLFKIAYSSRRLHQEETLHPALVDRLAIEASKTAKQILTMCIRALDYLPPMDITFGDYLRALITSDADLVPDDPLHYRTAIIEAFRRHGIYPENVRSLSENSLLWEDPAFEKSESLPIVEELEKIVQGWDLKTNREDLFIAMNDVQEKVHEIIEQTKSFKQKQISGIDLHNGKFEVHSIRPVRRIGPDGQLLTDLLIEITQRRPGKRSGDLSAWNSADEVKQDFWYRGGCTLIVDMKSTRIRYCIFKDINDEFRYKRQQDYHNSFIENRLLSSLHSEEFDRDDLYKSLHRFCNKTEL